jgi:hypothetical protein
MGYTYSNGLPFSTILKDNIDDAILRVKKNKASCIVLDGGVGDGKTTLAIHISDYINKAMGLEELDLSTENRQIGLGGKEFSKKMRICYKDRLPVIIYDEAGDFARRGAMTSFNNFINRIFETYRAFKIIVVICLPLMYKLDNTLFDNKIPRFTLHLDPRGDTQGNFKGYSLHRAFFVRGLMRKLEDKNYAYKIIDPNFYGHFLDLPPARSNQLNVLSTKGKIEILQKTEAHLGNYVNYQDINNFTGLSISSIRMKLKQHNVKPSTYIGRIVYFDKSVLELMRRKDFNDGWDKSQD